MRRRLLTVALAALAGVLAGCDTEVELTFINETPEAREIVLTAPGLGTTRLGSVAPHAGRLDYELVIEREYIPANCSWRAGDMGSGFRVDKSTPDRLRFYATPDGPVGPVEPGKDAEGKPVKTAPPPKREPPTEDEKERMERITF